MRGSDKLLTLLLNTQRMIDILAVKELVQEWLNGTDYFLVDLTISTDNRIVVEIDHAEGVWIEDCVELSRYIESHLSRDEEDYELEVGSAGLGQPFKVLQQYVNHIGKPVEVLTNEGKKLRGTLTAALPTQFEITVATRTRVEGKKRPQTIEQPITLGYDDVKYTKYLISFK